MVELPNFEASVEGREIFSIWSFPIKQNYTSENFYTDANGLEMIKRNVTELDKYGEPKGNQSIFGIERFLYPVTSAIAFRSESTRGWLE